MATIEIDGKSYEVENGKTIIEVADEVAKVHIPRFCYHKKLSVAANCRMCLVQVDNGRKPVPACATPITDGMKVFTKSEETLHSQKAVMEFLLINHPLDCPICDQGGECELQDVSMGFGYDDSEYDETKRSVEDDNLGTLISTEMTRCIHCTRCVRFGDEIAGVRELGATGRGEKMQIGTYVQHSMTSEVSGNIIDLCPVGALTSKPFRFTARAWELAQHDSVAPHDCLGSNIHIHVRRNRLMRVVPKENELINETWISDRDRFSYIGLNHPGRLKQPMLKKDGIWEVVDWAEALKFVAHGIERIIKQYGSEQFAAFSSPSATLEEMYLLQKLLREKGVHHLDYRIQQNDFRDQATIPATYTNTLAYADLDNQEHILLLGCNIHREVPLAGTRVRKAWRNGARIFALNPIKFDYHFDVSAHHLVSPQELPLQLAMLVRASTDDPTRLPESLQRLIVGLEPEKVHREIVEALCSSNAVIVSGLLIENHPEAALLRTLIHALREATGARNLRFTAGANSAGGALAGMLPHQGAFGRTVEQVGLNVQDALAAKLKGYLLHAIDPVYDFENPHRARQSLLAAEFVVMLSAYDSESIREYANVILPIAPYAETSGTYVNVDGNWQTVKGACKPLEDARPAWKIFRVLGNLLHCINFDYVSSEDVLSEIKTAQSMMMPSAYEPFYPETLPLIDQQLVRIGEWPLYRSDAIVRHAAALQNCAASDAVCIRIHPQTADRLKLGDSATVSQGDIEITLPLKRDDRISLDAVCVPNAMPETIDLEHSFAAINIKR